MKTVVPCKRYRGFESHSLRQENWTKLKEYAILSFMSKLSGEKSVHEGSQDQLYKTIDEAAERMVYTVPQDEWETIMDITARTQDPDLVAEFLEKHRDHLAPESVFFLEMSEAVKRSRIEPKQ